MTRSISPQGVFGEDLLHAADVDPGTRSRVHVNGVELTEGLIGHRP